MPYIVDSNLSVIKQVSVDDYNEFFSYFSFYNYYYSLQEINRICNKEKDELLKISDPKYLIKKFNNTVLEPGSVIQDANRIFLFYCLSLRILVDRIECSDYLSCENIRNFKTFTHDLFDDQPVYRFFYKMRNYVVHNKMPVSYFPIKNFEICMMRDELLKWKNWNQAKDYIKQQDEFIDINSLVKDISDIQAMIYKKGMSYLKSGLVESDKNIKKWMINHNVNAQISFSDENPPKTIYPVNLIELKEVADELNRLFNTNIRISFNIKKLNIKVS